MNPLNPAESTAAAAEAAAATARKVLIEWVDEHPRPHCLKLKHGATTLVRTMTLYAKRKAGFHNMRPERARALSCRGTRTVVELANDYAHTYAPFIQAAVREVGHNYRQVANWLTRERIPAQRAGQWKAQSVKNLVVRYWRLTGRRILIPYKRFPTPAHRRRRT